MTDYITFRWNANSIRFGRLVRSEVKGRAKVYTVIETDESLSPGKERRLHRRHVIAINGEPQPENPATLKPVGPIGSNRDSG